MPNHMLQFNNRSLEKSVTVVKLQAAATLITMMMKKKLISSYKRFFPIFESIDLLYTNNDLMLLSYVQLYLQYWNCFAIYITDIYSMSVVLKGLGIVFN